MACFGGQRGERPRDTLDHVRRASKQYVFVPILLNTASDEDILTIPGLGNSMLREFKANRPYKNIEQFRREIGKYADKKNLPAWSAT